MKRSKILSLLLAVLMIMSSISCLTVVSSAAVVDGSYEYDETDTVIATYWELDDAGVLTVYPNATPTWLAYAGDITKVVLEKGVKEIPFGAFRGCYNLVEVDTSKADSDLVSIGNSAFTGCTSLPSFKTNAVLAYLGAGCFLGATSLKSVSFAYVGEIPDEAFYNCDSLETAFFGGGFEEGNVGVDVFKDCDNLETVVFGDGIKEIGYAMFEDCASLKYVDFPNSLKVIGALAFENCTSLTEVIIPDHVTEVGRYAFHNCESVERVYIGHKAEVVNEYAFYGCTSLKTVEIASAMRAISVGAFMDCTSLETVEIEESVETIGATAFKNCASLKSFEIPATVTMIGESAFDNSGLTEINIPWNVLDIGFGAFSNCSDLTDINVDAKNPDYASIDGALYDVALDILICCPAGKTGTYKVYDGTTTITDGAFIGCDKLQVVEIPDSVEVIANTAFNGCSKDLVIKAGCTTVAADFAKKRNIAFEAIHSEETKWETTLEPTCEATGERSRVCTLCGYVFEKATVDAIGHQFDSGVVTKKATCEEDGVVTFTCTRTDCGEFFTQSIPATNHKYDTGVVVLEPTCEATGIKRFTCQNDGCYSYYDIDVPATGHNYTSSVTKEPTCEEEGVKTTTCDRCGDYTTEAIPATGHAYNDGVVTTEATCEADGEKTITCTNCGDSYTEAIPAIGHNYVESVVKPATCVEHGKNTFKCLNCGDSYDVATTGEHKLYESKVTIKPTCTEEGKTGKMCAICKQFVGEVETIPATGHKYKNGTCSTCGHKDPNYKVSRPATPKMGVIKNEVKGITVTWSAVKGANHYRVYRRGAGQKWSYIGKVTTNSCIDTKATTGEYWRYTVIAVSDTGVFSGYESGIYIKRVDTPHMKKLTNTAKGINVTWTPVSNAKEYRVYRRGEGGTWSYIGTTKNTSFVDTGIKNAYGKYWRYTVRAVDGYYSSYESGIYIKRVK